MATAYAYGNNTAWTDTGIFGPCVIESGMGEIQLHFGTVAPVTYEDGKHHHLFPNDVPFYYNGSEKVFIRAHNNNVSGITQKCKAIITNV